MVVSNWRYQQKKKFRGSLKKGTYANVMGATAPIKQKDLVGSKRDRKNFFLLVKGVRKDYRKGNTSRREAIIRILQSSGSIGMKTAKDILDGKKDFPLSNNSY